MRGINHVIIGGNLGRDPDVRHTQEGKKVLTFSIAISRKQKGHNGEDREVVYWVPVVVFSELADICERTLSKGDEVAVYGHLVVREWEDAESREKRRVTEIQAREIHFLSIRKWRERCQQERA